MLLVLPLPNALFSLVVTCLHVAYSSFKLPACAAEIRRTIGLA